MEEETELRRLVQDCAWLMDVLCAARSVDAPQWWIGGGVLRDLVWDTQASRFSPDSVHDVDLAFYDPEDLSEAREQQVEAHLRSLAPLVPWEARNQAAVHTWYHLRFEDRVEALTSAADGVATWPETATAVAVKLDRDDMVQVLAPYGLHDLMTGVCRRNPRRVSEAEFQRRLQRKQVATRWPHVRVIHDVVTS